MSIIGISGKIGSGKDEVSKIIQYLSINNSINDNDWRWTDNYQRFMKETDLEMFSNHNKWEVVRFADKLKDTVCRWIGCTREQLEDREFKEKPLGEEWDRYKVICPKFDIQELHSSEEDAKFAVATYRDYFGEGDYQILRQQLTPRRLMQLLGTEAGREIIHPDIWVNATMAEYDKSDFIQQLEDGYHEINQKQWIIPDTRFPNEAQAVKDKNGVVIRVERSLENRFPEIAQEYGYVSSNPREMESMLDGYIHREYPELYKKIHHESETALDGYEDFDYVLYNNFSIKTLFESVKEILEQEEIIE